MELLETQSSAMLDSVAVANSKVDAVKTQVDSEVATLDSKIALNSTIIATNQSTTNARISPIESDLANVNTAISTLTSTVTNNGTDITANKDDLTAFKSSTLASLTGLDTRVTSIDGSLLTVATNSNALKNDFNSYKASNDAEVVTLKGKDVTLENSLNQTKTDLANLNTDYTSYKTVTNDNVTSVQTAITSTQSDLSSYKTETNLVISDLQITTTSLGTTLSTKADTSVLSNYATKEDLESVTIDTSSLEKIASKATTIDSASIADTTKYPTVKAVSDFVTTEISKIPSGGGSGSVSVEALPYTVDVVATNIILGSNDQIVDGTANKGVVTSKVLDAGSPEATYIPNINIPFTTRIGFVATSKAVGLIPTNTQISSPLDIVPLIGTSSGYDEIITISKGTGTVDISVVKLSTGSPSYSLSQPNYADEFVYLEIKNNKLSIYLGDTLLASDAYTFDYQFSDNSFFVSVGAVMNGSNLYSQNIAFDLSKGNKSTTTINSVDGKFYTVPVDLTILSQTVKADSVISFYDNGTKFIYIDRVPEENSGNPEVPDVDSKVISVTSSDIEESFTTGNAFQSGSYTTTITYDAGDVSNLVADSTNLNPMRGLIASQPIANKSVVKIGLTESRPLVLTLSNDSSINTINLNDASSTPSPVLIFTHEDGINGSRLIKIKFAFNNLYSISDIGQFNWYAGASSVPSVIMYFDKDLGKVYFMPDFGFNNEIVATLDIGDYLGYLKPANLYVNLQDYSTTTSYISATSFRYMPLEAKRIKKPVGADFKTYYKITNGGLPNWNKLELGNPVYLEDNDYIVFVDEATNDFVTYKNKEYNVTNYTLNDLDVSRPNPVNSNAVTSFVTNKTTDVLKATEAKAYSGFKPFGIYPPSLHSDSGTNPWKLESTNDYGRITVPVIFGYAPTATYRYGKLVSNSEDYTTFTINAEQGNFSVVIGGVTITVDSRTQFRLSENPNVTYDFNLELGFIVRRLSDNEYSVIVLSNSYSNGGLSFSKTGYWDGSILFNFTPNTVSETKLSLQNTLNVSFDTSSLNSLTKIRHSDVNFKPWLAKCSDLINVTQDGLDIDGTIYNTGDIVQVLSTDVNNLNYKYSMLYKPTSKWVSGNTVGDPMNGLDGSNCILEFANLDGYLWVRGRLKIPFELTVGQPVFRILSPLYKCFSHYAPVAVGKAEMHYGTDFANTDALISYITPSNHDLVLKANWSGAHTDWIYINPTSIGKIA